MDPTEAVPAKSGLSANRVAVLAILVCWITQFMLLTAEMAAAESAMNMPVMRRSEMIARGCVSIVGIALSCCIALLLRSMRTTTLGQRIATAAGAALACSLLHAVANFGIFWLVMPAEALGRATIAS